MSTSDSEQYASAAAVSGLAREIEQVRQTVDGLKSIPAQVDELARVVRELAERTAGSQRRPEAAGAPSWLDQPEELDTVRVVLEQLTDWMRQVYLRYADAARHLPECWLWHPDVVEELLWLMTAWFAAYRDENATVLKAGDWHDRYRPGVVRRIKTLAGACSLENHQPRDGRLPGGPVVPLAEAMEPIAHWWASSRTQAPPEPSEEQVTAATRPRRAGGGRR